MTTTLLNEVTNPLSACRHLPEHDCLGFRVVLSKVQGTGLYEIHYHRHNKYIKEVECVIIFNGLGFKANLGMGLVGIIKWNFTSKQFELDKQLNSILDFPCYPRSVSTTRRPKPYEPPAPTKHRIPDLINLVIYRSDRMNEYDYLS